jgi:hypothetical protein
MKTLIHILIRKIFNAARSIFELYSRSSVSHQKGNFRMNRARSFVPGIFAPRGAIQFKEVAGAKKGTIFTVPMSHTNSLIQKEFSHEK